jgi:hypothetical protein
MFNLFIPYYNDAANFRQLELDWCLKHNCENYIIENMFIFPEFRRNRLPKLSEKAHTIHLDKRVTYQDIISYINSMVDSYRYYNIIANTDIYFDNSLNNIRLIDMSKTCLTLTRWESNPGNGDPYMFMTHQSSDVWIFKSYISFNIECDFYMGVPGCEGRFNFEVARAGYSVFNPAKSIKCLHYHTSGKRNWSEDDRLLGGSLNPEIISIEDIINA